MRSGPARICGDELADATFPTCLAPPLAPQLGHSPRCLHEKVRREAQEEPMT